jgi:sirohydrochlorin cobaltochelatase
MPSASILLVAYGSRHPAAGQAFDTALARIRERFPDLPVEMAFSSRKVREATGTPSPDTALARLAEAGREQVVVQSLHVLPGSEFAEITRAAKRWRGHFKALHVGLPLLANQADVERVAQVLTGVTPDNGAAQCIIVHGTRGPGQLWLRLLDEALTRRDPRFFLGTLEGGPGPADIAHAMRGKGFSRALLTPLFFATGHHAAHDLDPANPDSWPAALTRAGIAAEVAPFAAACHVDLMDVWLDHLAAALARLAPNAT